MPKGWLEKPTETSVFPFGFCRAFPRGSTEGAGPPELGRRPHVTSRGTGASPRLLSAGPREKPRQGCFIKCLGKHFKKEKFGLKVHLGGRWPLPGELTPLRAAPGALPRSSAPFPAGRAWEGAGSPQQAKTPQEASSPQKGAQQQQMDEVGLCVPKKIT